MRALNGSKIWIVSLVLLLMSRSGRQAGHISTQNGFAVNLCHFYVLHLASKTSMLGSRTVGFSLVSSDTSIFVNDP